MAVLDFLTHGYCEYHTQSLHKIFVLVSVIDDGVYHTDVLLSGIEVQPHGEGHPFPLSAGCAVHTFEFDHCPQRAGLLQGNFLEDS